MVSTGEVTAAEYAGTAWQGGHSVRMVDLRIEAGDSTVNAGHAAQLDAFVRRHHGVAGLAWATHLAKLSDDEWRGLEALVGDIKEGLESLLTSAAELSRIANHFAVVAAALIEASRMGLVPWHRDDIEALVAWALVDRVAAERVGMASPEERALSALQTSFLKDGQRWTPVDDMARGRDAIGIRSGVEWYTTEEMLIASGIPQATGCGPRQFLMWLEKSGRADRVGRQLIGKLRRRWWKITSAVEGGTEEVSTATRSVH